MSRRATVPTGPLSDRAQFFTHLMSHRQRAGINPSVDIDPALEEAMKMEKRLLQTEHVDPLWCKGGMQAAMKIVAIGSTNALRSCKCLLLEYLTKV